MEKLRKLIQSEDGTCIPTVSLSYNDLGHGASWDRKRGWIVLEQTSKLVFHAQSTITVISGRYSKQINYIYISELRSRVEREVGLALIPCPVLPLSLISPTISVS